jgi:hypothetical protein
VDPYHLVRSLTFFEDGEAETTPEMLALVAWGQITGDVPPKSANPGGACR